MISEIQEKIAKGEFEFSKHAVDYSIIRSISVNDMCEAIVVGEIIEDYPDDKYGPSCLVYGRTIAGRHIHIQCSYPTRDPVKIITVYEPDAESWINFKTRRKR